MNGMQLSTTLMYLDNLVFPEHDLFKITDSAAFPYKGYNVKYIRNPDSVVITGSSERTVIVSFAICVTTIVPGGWLTGCPPGDPNCLDYVEIHDCTFYNVIADDGYEISEDYPPPPQEGSGGGGGNDLCRLFPGATETCGTGGPPGFDPVDEAEEYNPYVYDSISVSNELLDSGFNCLYDILKNDLSDINRKVQLTLFNVFGVSLYNHVHFEMNWSADSTTDWVAITEPGERIWVGDSIMYFYDTVQINPYFAVHATKEMLIATAIHESIHAYINWCFTSYDQGANGVDSNYLIEHFPIHWEYLMNRPFKDDYQHNLIVNNYVNEIVDAVMAGGNQNAPQGIRNFVGTALAYTGMKKTSVWATLADSCDYKGVGAWCQYYDRPGGWQYTPSGCGNYPMSFRDSLQLLGPCQ